MNDVIQLRGLRVDAICGVLPHERTEPQPLELDLDVDCDLTAAARSDHLDDTVDYGAVVAAAARVAETLAPQLLEHLAGCIADAVLALDDRITGVTVSVRKLQPPVPERLATSGVRLTRTR